MAGHDRTSLSLTSAAARQWLNPTSADKAQFFATLDAIKRLYYAHAVAA